MNCKFLLDEACLGRAEQFRYHHLNHHAIFGGGYKGGALSIMRDLHRKYSRKSEI